MKEFGIDEINDVPIFHKDLENVTQHLLSDPNPWPRLLTWKDANSSSSLDNSIIETAYNWLGSVSSVAGAPELSLMGRSELITAFKITIHPEDVEKFDLVAHALAYRASALIRVIVEHCHGRSYDIKAPIEGVNAEKTRDAIRKYKDPLLLKAACLTEIKLNNEDLPCFNFKDFVENMKAVRDFQEYCR
jgi:hypothetical protein